MTRLALALLLALTACAKPAPPEPITIVREVKVPVARACIPPETPPAPVYKVTRESIARAPTDEEVVTRTAAGFEERDQRLRVIEPLIASCR